MKKAILFDLDGTLLYTLEDLRNATNATLRAFGYPERTLEEVRQFVGNGAENQMRCAVGFQPENFGEMMSWYREYYPRHCNETTRPYGGILKMTERLAEEGWLLAIVSNKPDDATKQLWKTYFPHFHTAQGQTAGIPRKPSPDMVWKVLDDLGVSRERAIYVGDSDVDIRTAKAAGLPCIACLWGYRDRAALEEAGGTYFAEGPEEIPSLARLQNCL